MKTSKAVSFEEFNNYPETITKEQMFKLCHISKKKAEWLLRSGFIPCEHTGKKTRCYLIKKTDVLAWLIDYIDNPAKYKAPDNWYKRMDQSERKKKFGSSFSADHTNRLNFMPPEFDEPTARQYYADKLANYKEALLSKEVAAFTGYCPRTVTSWVNEKKLRAIALPEKYVVPKEYLINFLVSDYYNKSIIKKSQKHFTVLWEIFNLSRSGK